MTGKPLEPVWEGVLPVWKPAGMTSHDVVAKVRRLLKMKRVGHTGTLDPAVTGVLPICLGRATRIVEYIQDLPKAYRAELTVGYATDTEDATGAVIARVERVELGEEQIRGALAALEGEIEQVPPMYSAVKAGGVRLYELARQGIEVERKPRRVTVYRIGLDAVEWSEPYPKIRFTAECSKGTYIRTLCVDLGRALGYPAVMSQLTRIASGGFTPEQCLTLEEIARLADSGGLSDRLVATDAALPHLPEYRLTAGAVDRAWSGRKLQAGDLQPLPTREEPAVRVYAPDGTFAGIYRIDPAAGLAIPEKLFT